MDIQTQIDPYVEVGLDVEFVNMYLICTLVKVVKVLLDSTYI